MSDGSGWNHTSDVQPFVLAFYTAWLAEVAKVFFLGGGGGGGGGGERLD